MRRAKPQNADASSIGVANIGPVSSAWLREIGVHSRQDLERTGAVEAYLRLRRSGRRVSLNLLYAMHAGLNDQHWTMLSPRQREMLRAAVGQ